MPLMMVTYSLGYWDKVRMSRVLSSDDAERVCHHLEQGMLSQAAIFNIRQDLNFYTPSSRYSLVSSFF